MVTRFYAFSHISKHIKLFGNLFRASFFVFEAIKWVDWHRLNSSSLNHQGITNWLSWVLRGYAVMQKINTFLISNGVLFLSNPLRTHFRVLSVCWASQSRSSLNEATCHNWFTHLYYFSLTVLQFFLFSLSQTHQAHCWDALSHFCWFSVTGAIWW